ncbi:hypothetical protein N7493_010732 [Penicillium malachiteum]|uniref:XPG-I domain-containing protein n=1 Tax=Penicillium malachiteum TaxID=1324776 RepID=A0AAD6HDC4_9EURO|nr:hypothetical protein N7493_010732 [Penicillium malachiteum]
MGISGLIHAIGKGDRVSLSKLAVSHLERTSRPIRVAVDISIWLFQVQASRGGKNPELRTLFYRLLNLLALPVHPLFVYDGRHKPPFKRGKRVSYGSAPIIQRSKDLIERFQFPWHEAPGEAEAECARLQQAGIVDAVMSNDVDALMFGSTWTIMNFSKEKGSGTTAATHVTCYRMGTENIVSNVSLGRAGMILFAMLSGGDYLPGGVPKCGARLAEEIAKASFGEDLLQELASHSPDIETRIGEWRERLQYELDENESGYFATKHKAVRIPENFPDRQILEWYAEPKVSTEDEMAILRRRLKDAWDREIDPLAIRTYAAEHFEWNYRSGARKVIKLLAPSLVSYRLRLQRPVSGLSSGKTLAPDCDDHWLQKIYRSRANFGTDGMTELQMDMLPIDVVGIDLLAEELAPLPPVQETGPSEEMIQEDDEDDPEIVAGEPPPTPSKTPVRNRYDPFETVKIWVFETVAKLGVPDVVKAWDDEQAEKEAAKARKAAPKPKKPTTRRTGPRKKGPIDPNMKHGSILKYGTMTKDKSELSQSNKKHMLVAASSQSPVASAKESSAFKTSPSFAESIDLETDFPPRTYSQQQTYDASHDVDDLIDSFSSLVTASPPKIKRHPLAGNPPAPVRTPIAATGETEIDDLGFHILDPLDPLDFPASKGLKISHSVSTSKASDTKVTAQNLTASSPKKRAHDKAKRVTKPIHIEETPLEVDGLEKAVSALSLSVQRDEEKSSETSIPKSRSSCPKKSEKYTDKLSAVPNTQKVNKNVPGPRQTSGHLENISTYNGFWSIDEPAASDSLEMSTESHGRIYANTEPDSKSKAIRKRFSRVSIIDMT